MKSLRIRCQLFLYHTNYIAIPYPEGYIDSETMFLFMQEDIENVSFVGFVDAEMQVFRTALEETDENDAEKESDS